MSSRIQQIYCDESGATGNNLMHPAQPIFTYASIAISHEEAKDCVDRITRDFRVQGGELKARNLLGYNYGKHAISRILEEHHERILVSAYHKQYSLACKLFEYALEPALSSVGPIIYSIGFHKFIGDLLYLHLKAGTHLAEEIFEDFERMMRQLSDTSAAHLFGAVHFPENNAIDLVRRFCLHNRRAILEELDSLRGHGAGKWVLDLTDTSLFTHLGTWGAKYDQLDVYCDKTQALEAFWDLMKVMIGRK